MTKAETFACAVQYFQRGLCHDAEMLSRQIVASDAGHADGWCLLGACCQAQGKLADAETSLRRAIAILPNHPSAHSFLAAVLAQSNKLDDAAKCFEELLQAQAADAEAWNNFGLLRIQQGQWNDALTKFRQAVRLKPDWAEARGNLAMALQHVGQVDEAIAQNRQALRLRPNYAEAHYNLGDALLSQGMIAEAALHCQQAIQCRPGFPEAHNSLGMALRAQQKWPQAMAHFEEALRLRPEFAAAHFNLGSAFGSQGNVDQAETHYRKGLQCGGDKRHQVQLATLLPLIYQSREDVLRWRQRLTDNLRQLHEQHFSMDLTDDTASPPFALAYQGFNDRDLQRDLARLYCAPSPKLRPKAAGKIKVGFVSSNFRNHTIGELSRGVIAQLNRQLFSVSVLSVGRHQDQLNTIIRQSADNYVELPGKLKAARQAIADQQLDVLYYTDIGMDAATYSLAFSRLAPVQCVTWGHPVTTGMDTIDYFISSQHLDTPESKDHYTEKLVRLSVPAIYYYRPPAPMPLKRRIDLGLPASGTLYVCAQTLFKFHPDFDAILADILRRDQAGVLILLQGLHSQWAELLKQRFAKTMPDVFGRVRFLPMLNYSDFLSLNAAADVLLDTLHFGGGNTSYEALALGTPIVTAPTSLMRSRITLALYKQIGIMDCVVSSPAEYVERAVQLGTDADYRAAIRAKILAANGVLYENKTGVLELELFLQKAVTH